jgi:HEAT repeat protein
LFHYGIESEVNMLATVQNHERQLDSLIDDLKSDHALTRRYARESLVAIGMPAVPPLMALLSDSNTLTRWEAVKTLGEIGGPDVAEALVRMMESDQDEGVRWLASDGLAGLQEEGLVPLLEALIHHSDSVWLRDSAHHALRKLLHTKLAKLVAPVLEALEGIEPAIVVPPVAQNALKALKEHDRR